MKILELYARLAKDPSAQRSLFTGKFDGLQSITMTLSNLATGTANFAIYENNVQKVAKNVTASDQSLSYRPQAGATVEYYINSYNETDLPQVHITVS
tara:strand:- start:23600 stop:23890 length:291 start_codon:yes stop_codon:yes gene_type:complete